MLVSQEGGGNQGIEGARLRLVDSWNGNGEMSPVDHKDTHRYMLLVILEVDGEGAMAI